MMANARCLSGCRDTEAMAATQDGGGADAPTTTCTAPMAFTGNQPGSPQLLCSTNQCTAFVSSGDACRGF